MKKRLSAVLLALVFVFSAIPAVNAAEEGYAPTGTDITVSKTEITNSGFVSAVQSALNKAKNNATASNPYTVKVASGSYTTSSVIRVYSNTTLDLSGVSLKRSGTGNMIRVGTEDTDNTGATGYAYYENVKIKGGTFDGNNGENTIIKAFHTTNFTMDGCSLKNEKNGHMTEFAGVDGLNILNCSFKNQLLDKGKNGYEAIQLDVLHPYHVNGARCEDLCCMNVLVEGCTFDNVPRGVGSHTSVLNNPHKNINIRCNRFTNITSIAIQGAGWQNADIRCNYIDNAPRGITVYNAADAKTYLSSKLASKGNTTSHFGSTSLNEPAVSDPNINIAYNELHNIGTSADAYAWYSSQGIAVIGKKLTSKSSVDSEDESGGLPAGEYFIDNVDIHDNYIDIRGNGIRTEYTLNTNIKGNVIICSKNTVVSDNYYGIVMRNTSKNNGISIDKNTVIGAEINGIHLDKVTGHADITRNRVNDSGKYGIVFYTSEIGKVSGNTVDTCVNSGIKVVSASSVDSIDNNRVTGSQANAVHIDKDCSCSMVKNNLTYSSSGNIQYTKSAGLVTIGTNYTYPEPAESVHIEGDIEGGIQMGLGTTFMTYYSLGPAYADGNVAYEISDPDIARIDEYGRVIPTSEGYALITVTADSGVSSYVPLHVTGGYENDSCVSGCRASASGSGFIGDADDDRNVCIMDVTFVQRCCAEISDGYDEFISARCDIDSDGEIDADDACFIMRAILDIPIPYPCGNVIA